jgi:biotin synthase
LNINNVIDFYKNAPYAELLKKANEVCKNNYGNKVYLRGLIEFSNYCTEDCLYCGIRKSNYKVNRYRLTEDEIIKTVEEGYKSGLKTFVLQSGEDNYFTIKKLVSIITKIKSVTEGVAAITLSCGIKTKSQYKEIKSAGCDRYLMRFETSDKELYKYLKNGKFLERRLKALNELKELEFEVGSGFMVGLPGETEEIRINNAILCSQLQLNMVGIGPFIPHPDTPLKDCDISPIDLAVKSVALVRLLLPGANIPATTAAGSLSKDGREKMLFAGANVLMPNITPTVYKKDYLLYPGKICLDETGFQCIGCLSKRVATVNKELCYERGDSLMLLH